MNEKTIERDHALLSASGAHRWLFCTRAPRLEELEPNTAGAAAEEGTTAHAVAEVTARYWIGELSEAEYENRIAELAKDKWYNREMQDHCNDYARLVLEKLNAAREVNKDAFAMIEQKVPFDDWVPEGFGTADALIVSDTWLEVVDFKYGKGHRVTACGNPQMRLYALGAYHLFADLFNFDSVRMTIYQPRLSGVQDSDELALSELLRWGVETVSPAAKKAFAGEGDFCPDDEVCKFCAIRGKCRARAQKLVDLFDAEPGSPTLALEEAGALLERASDMKAWLSDLEKFVFGALMEGKTVDDWKLVEGRSNRKYADEAEIAKALKKAGYKPDQYYKKTLIPLTQMEKDFGKKVVAELIGDLIVKPAGAPRLAPASDKRPEYMLEAELLKAFDEGGGDE